MVLFLCIRKHLSKSVNQINVSVKMWDYFFLIILPYALLAHKKVSEVYDQTA